MAKLNLRSAYLYLVCLVTLVIFISGIILTITNLTDLFLDEGYYQSLDEFALRFERLDLKTGRTQTELSAAEIQSRYAEYLRAEQDRQFKRNLRELINSLAALVVGGSFWLYHWRQIGADRES